MDNKILNVLFFIGALLVLVSSVVVMENIFWGKYTFAVGAAFYIIIRVLMKYRGEDSRISRLNRSYTVSVVLMLFASYLQFKNNNIWVILLLLIALIELFTNLRIAWYEKNPEIKDN